MTGALTLIGAGELMSAGSGLHRAALARLDAPPRPVFLDTTAGFETNADAIAEKAVEYYGRHLQAELRVARYQHAERAGPAAAATAVAAIRDANVIFAGPGSPTYLIDQLCDSPVWNAVRERFQAGAHLIFASAAAIALGRYALPIYEIFKVGADPHWVDGLDLLGPEGLALAIVPHYNDASGGQNYDSRFCYMGAARFDALQAALPPHVTILGIDAYTACTIDPRAQTAAVSGQGGVTVISDAAQRRYESGETVPFSALRSSDRALAPTFVEEERLAGYEFADEPGSGPTVETVDAYVRSLTTLTEAEEVELMARVRALTDRLGSGPAPQEDALMDLVMELRDAFRNMKRYDLADHVRDALTALGFVVADGPEGSSWKRP